MDFVSLLGANVSSDFSFPTPTMIILWYLLHWSGWGYVCVHVHMPCVPFNSSMSESHRAHYALAQTLCSIDVGFR